MRVFDLTIRSLVDENFIYARALSYLGVEFYMHPDRKLKEVCEEMGLDRGQVLKTFYQFDQSHRFSFNELQKYPLEIVVEYLRHSHHQFIKNKLPYIARLIANYPEQDDLKLIFPEFVEEFINHIYEEEDTLFHYLERLVDIQKKRTNNPAASLWKYRSVSLQTIHEDHKEEDELAGIRTLIESTTNAGSIHWQVICKELKSFDREMWYHAEIENKILFPKAIALETSIKDQISELSKLN